MPRVWALSGTPGVGKSSAAARLSRRGWQVFSSERLAGLPGVKVGRDRARRAALIDPAKVGKAVVPHLDGSARGTVLEALWAHEVPVATHVVVLRLNPRTLAKRLEARGWSPAKVRENVEAEALGVIAGEALGRVGARRAFELDVSGMRRHEVARRVDAVLGREADALMNAKIGRVDWSAQILGWF